MFFVKEIKKCIQILNMLPGPWGMLFRKSTFFVTCAQTTIHFRVCISPAVISKILMTGIRKGLKKISGTIFGMLIEVFFNCRIKRDLAYMLHTNIIFHYLQKSGK